jgi:hypothetical protein
MCEDFKITKDVFAISRSLRRDYAVVSDCELLQLLLPPGSRIPLE